jgi:predicted RNA binding protein YcfA (HicA-like mRNA interferase family)
MPKLPPVSSQSLLKLLLSMGYRVERQRGSHIQLRKTTSSGLHNVTVPDHKEIAKGTLNDILNSVGLHNGIPKAELFKKLQEK